MLLLDDPLRNVDAKLRYEMRLELPALLKRSGSSVLYVTQDYKEAMALGDRVAVLLDGRIAQLDTPARVYGEPATLGVARLITGSTSIPLTPDPIAKALFGTLIAGQFEVAIIWAIVIALVVAWILQATKYGNWIFATGGDTQSARAAGIPVPALSSSLAYYDAYRSARLPANLTQAQRDFFGAHTYRRIDRDGVFHTDWTHA